jgi:hypothetical protein
MAKGNLKPLFGKPSGEGKKASAKSSAKPKLGEPHHAIPHLYRTPKPRTAASDLYPYLRSGMAVLPGGAVFAKLLSDSVRKSVSPLGGVAKPAPSKGRKR